MIASHGWLLLVIIMFYLPLCRDLSQENSFIQATSIPNQVWNRFQRVCSWLGECFMIINEVNFFQKTQKCKTRIGKAWGVGPPRCERHGMVKCHLTIQKCRMALLMCHVAPTLAIAHLCSSMQFRALELFLKDFLTFKKIFLVKLRHSDISNSLVFKNHHLHHCF